MTRQAPPKPPKRGRKPQKPLRRSAPPKRTKRPNRVRQTLRAAAGRAKDASWSRAVLEKGPCCAKWWPFEVPGSLFRSAHVCSGRVDPAHIFSRRYLATRHIVANGLPTCRRAHDYFGARPKEWERFARHQIGDAEYDRLYEIAQRGPKG